MSLLKRRPISFVWKILMVCLGLGREVCVFKCLLLQPGQHWIQQCLLPIASASMNCAWLSWAYHVETHGRSTMDGTGAGTKRLVDKDCHASEEGHTAKMAVADSSRIAKNQFQCLRLQGCIPHFEGKESIFEGLDAVLVSSSQKFRFFLVFLTVFLVACAGQFSLGPRTIPSSGSTSPGK